MLVSEAPELETEIDRYSCDDAGAASTHLVVTIACGFCLRQVEVALVHQLMLPKDLAQRAAQLVDYPACC